MNKTKMKTDMEVKIKEIKIYFKEQYSYLIDNMKDHQIQILWDLLNGRSNIQYKK